MSSGRGSLTGALADLVVPRDCAGCRTPGSALCAACERDVLGMELVRHVSGAWAADDPHGLGRSLVRCLKADQERAVVPALGWLLARAVERCCDRQDSVLIVPVPPRPRALRDRGIDPTGLICSAAIRQLAAGRYRQVAAARWRRQPADQRSLGAPDRFKNVAGALSVHLRGRAATGSTVMVAVDDVVTTGATLRELVRAITAAGGTVIGSAAAIATPRAVTESGLLPAVRLLSGGPAEGTVTYGP